MVLREYGRLELKVVKAVTIWKGGPLEVAENPEA
jgi:hypothetical protein